MKQLCLALLTVMALLSQISACTSFGLGKEEQGYYNYWCTPKRESNSTSNPETSKDAEMTANPSGKHCPK